MDQQNFIEQNGNALEKGAEDTPIPKAEVSLLNKILNKEINDMYEGKVEIRKLQADPSSPLHSTETFESLRLKPELIAACYAKGFQLPSKIQSACIPLILKTPAPDLVAQAQNGTGKTATFLLSVLQRIDTSIMSPQSIIIAPTLELAQQIVMVAKDLSIKMPDLRIRCATKGELVTPGTVFNDHIIIGSPGIAERWIVQHGAIDISKVFCIIFDEADDMLAMQNVQDNIFRILNHIKTYQPNCQLLFFSATYDDDAIRYMVEPFAPDAQYITLRRKDQSLKNIKQCLIYCGTREEKFNAILHIFSAITITSTIIFAYTKSSVKWIAEQLKNHGREVAVLHGDLPAESRLDFVRRFANSEFKVLITTNVAARGLDIPQVALVINYDPPVDNQKVKMGQIGTDGQLGYADYDTYLHRIGRTGRFGKPGMAVNMADNPVSLQLFKEIEDHFGCPMQRLDPMNYDQLEQFENSRGVV